MMHWICGLRSLPLTKYATHLVSRDSLDIYTMAIISNPIHLVFPLYFFFFQ